MRKHQIQSFIIIIIKKKQHKDILFYQKEAIALAAKNSKI